jgi:GNAT superfamily N-acetyltransferase
MTTPLTTFRPAKLEDLKQINELTRRSKGYWGYDAAFMDAFMGRFSVKPSSISDDVYVVMHLGQELVGFYGFAVLDTIILDYFFIDPPFIGKGYGRQMWAHVLKTASNHNWDQFTLWSDPGADDFYVKMGCEKIGEKPSPLAPNRFPKIFKCEVAS